MSLEQFIDRGLIYQLGKRKPSQNTFLFKGLSQNMHFVLIEEDLALDKTVSNKVWGNVTELRFLFSCSLNERHGLRLWIN